MLTYLAVHPAYHGMSFCLLLRTVDEVNVLYDVDHEMCYGLPDVSCSSVPHCENMYTRQCMGDIL